MSKQVQNYLETAHRSLYHHGFIKISVTFSLSELGMSWIEFLESLALQDEVPDTQQPEEQEIEQQTKEKKVKFPRQLRFPQNLGVCPKPPSTSKKIPYLEK